MTILNYYATTTMETWALRFVVFFATFIIVRVIIKVIRCTLDKRDVRKHCDEIKRIAQEVKLPAGLSQFDDEGEEKDA